MSGVIATAADVMWPAIFAALIVELVKARVAGGSQGSQDTRAHTRRRTSRTAFSFQLRISVTAGRERESQATEDELHSGER